MVGTEGDKVMPTGVYKRTDIHRKILSRKQKERWRKNPKLRVKISRAMEGNTRGFKKGNLGYWLGKKRAEGTNRKISETKKRQRIRLSDATKRALSKFNKQHPIKYWLGKKMPTSVKEKMGKSQRNRYNLLSPIERKKLGERVCGDKNWNWKGGITPENRKIRHSIEFRLWREAVFARDNWTCQKCKEKGGKLRPHHIKNFAQFPELRFAIDNGTTFCKECHDDFHRRYGRQNNGYNQIKEYLSANQ